MPILAYALRIIFHQIEVGLPIFAPLRPPRFDEGTLMVRVKLIEVHHRSFLGWRKIRGVRQRSYSRAWLRENVFALSGRFFADRARSIAWLFLDRSRIRILDFSERAFDKDAPLFAFDDKVDWPSAQLVIWLVHE